MAAGGVLADSRSERRESFHALVTPAEARRKRTEKQTNMKTRARSEHLDERDSGRVFINLNLLLQHTN